MSPLNLHMSLASEARFSLKIRRLQSLSKMGQPLHMEIHKKVSLSRSKFDGQLVILLPFYFLLLFYRHEIQIFIISIFIGVSAFFFVFSNLVAEIRTKQSMREKPFGNIT